MPQFTSLSISEALTKVVQSVTPKQESHFIPVIEALGRVLASDVKVVKNVPSFDNSAMDGFAYKYSDAGKELKVVAKVFAGDKEMPLIGEGECCKIMTGAKVPESVDTIAPIERCSDVSEHSVVVPQDIPQGANLRKKAEELYRGDVLLSKGVVLQPADIALLAAQGYTTVEVVSKLNIAIVSSGNEIKEPWEQADEDEIYNANAYGIAALLKQYGFEAHYIGSVPDQLDASIEFLSKLKSYDVIITTGGISMGDADYLYQAFEANGLKSLFHGVNVKPGRATMMGHMGNTFVMAMPGNPLTTMLNLFTLSLPPLFKMQGAKKIYPRALCVKAAKSLQFRAGRDNMILGYMQENQFYATNDNKIGSGMLSPLSKSDVIAYFGDDIAGYESEQTILVVSLGDQQRCEVLQFIN